MLETLVGVGRPAPIAAPTRQVSSGSSGSHAASVLSLCTCVQPHGKR